MGEAHEKHMELTAEQKIMQQAESRAELLRMCSLMDADGRDTLTFAHMATAFDQSPDFKRVLGRLGVQADEIQELFKLAGTLGSVEVNYKQFADHLYRFKSGELRSSQWKNTMHW